MKTTTCIHGATALLVASTAALISASAFGGLSQSATLGPVSIGGTLYAGGSNRYYQLNVTALVQGVVSAEARIKGKHWSAIFEPLSGLCSAGDNTFTSAGIPVPADFTGTAKLKLKARFNDAKLGKEVVFVLISPTPPTTSAGPAATLYDVSFNSSIALDANVAPTNGLGAVTSYAWQITDTDVRASATLSNTSTATPTLTTLPITAFTNAIVMADHVAPGIDLEKQFDLDTNPNLVGFNSEQVDLTTYHLQVVVSDAAGQSVTGQVTVLSTSVSPAQPTIALGERAYLTAMPNGTNGSTYSWSFALNPDGSPAIPDGSTAVIENPTTRTASLRPDKQGEYVMQLAVTGSGCTSNSVVSLKGASYVGVATCASCHGTSPLVGLDDYYSPWAQTKHSTMAQRGVDGILSPAYNESCLACHSLGNNKAPWAVNGGFDDLQQTLGWMFPTVLQHGNYAAMPDGLKNLANVQCENCHGPGSEHPGAQSKSLDVAVCATCHQDGKNYFRPSQWALGPHGADDGYLAVSQEEGINPSCSRCHSPAGFVDWQKGKAPVRALAGRLTCQACHDPHNEAMFPSQAHQVRVYDTVILDSGVTLTGQGTSALCEQCHNARRAPANFMATFPHESTATDVLNGFGGVTSVNTNGLTSSFAPANSPHSTVAKCVNCHMHNAGKNTVGNRSFSLTDRLTDADNLAACNQR